MEEGGAEGGAEGERERERAEQDFGGTEEYDSERMVASLQEEEEEVGRTERVEVGRRGGGKRKGGEV